MGQSQQQDNALPPKPTQEDILAAQKKANRKKRLQKMQEVDTTKMRDENSEDFLEQFKQFPGQ
jgi:hypothetical protein